MALPLLVALAATAADPPARPNVVLIVTDDQGYGDLGCAGNPVVRTPHLDALAAAGTRLDPFYVHPVCAPTRAAVMTGRYPERGRVVDTWIGRAMLDPDEVTVAEVLRDAGWATGIFGKWHLGDCAPMRPQDQGFEEVLVHRGGGIGQPSDPPGAEGDYTDPVLQANGVERRFEGYCTDVYFRAALGWIGRCVEGERPFFAYVATNAPHGPFHDVPADWLEVYRGLDVASLAVGDAADADRLARILAMVSNVDENVGRLVAGLDELGALEDTLVLFHLDNGPNTRRWVGELRGRKGEVYEGGVRSPLLARWDGVIPAAARTRALGADVDVMPTILDACGVAPPEGVPLDGRSLMPALVGLPGELDPRRVVHVAAHRGDRRLPRHNFLVRRGDWKLLRASGFGRRAPPPDAPYELYDLASDPGETRDLASEHPALVEELLAQHVAWFDDVATTREDPWTPPRIRIGGPGANRIVLTRQDWRTDDESWSGRAFGRWLVDVVDRGPWRIKVRLPEASTARFAEIGWGSGGATAPVEDGVAVFDAFEFPPRLDTLEVRARDGDEAWGAHQVELVRAL